MDERVKWNDRYAAEHTLDRAPGALVEALPHLPTEGFALEIAGGLGGGARALARHGLAVTLTDISAVALAKAAAFANAEGLAIDTAEIDFRTDPFPPGPWQVITCFHYLHRPLLVGLVDHLAPGGVAAVGIATVTNLERHARPPRAFLLEPGELREVLSRLEPITYSEGWTDDGIHEARLVGRRVD